jgi:hypothetical protein
MNIRILLSAALIALGVPAAADFVTVVEAYEVQLADLRLPGNNNGTLSFKPCSDCDYRTVRVTAATRYEANDRGFTLEDFRKELTHVRNPADQSVTVLHHLQSDTITALRVTF